jgi:hypothetical protein
MVLSFLSLFVVRRYERQPESLNLQKKVTYRKGMGEN